MEVQDVRKGGVLTLRDGRTKIGLPPDVTWEVRSVIVDYFVGVPCPFGPHYELRRGPHIAILDESGWILNLDGYYDIPFNEEAFHFLPRSFGHKPQGLVADLTRLLSRLFTANDKVDRSPRGRWSESGLTFLSPFRLD